MDSFVTERKAKKLYDVKSLHYENIVIDTYYEVEKIFSIFSEQSNKVLNLIGNEIDFFGNDNDTKTKALRHHFSDGIYKALNDYSKNILYENELALFNIKLGKYSKLIYDFDFINQEMDYVKEQIKILYENIDAKDRKKLCKNVSNILKDVYKIYEDNKILVDSKIELMRKEYSKFRRYDFEYSSNILKKDFLELFNLLKYIKYVSECSHISCSDGFENLTISWIFTDVLYIMVVNQGILELSRLRV